MDNHELSKRAMLVSVCIKLEGLLGERRDRAASELVESTYSVASRRAKASKFLIDRKHPKVKSVVAQAQQVRAVVYRYTFPWGDSGLRILPVKAYDLFHTKVNAALVELKSAIDQYILVYPSLVKSSEAELGKLFDISQYPTPDQARKLFKSSVDYWPMPEAGHFVADIANEAAQEARETIRTETIARTNEAINDLVNRVQQTVKFYVDKLGAYRVEGEKSKGDVKISGIFRDSLVENVADMGRLIHALNFTDDAGISSLATQVERLSRVTAESLRENDAQRSSMISEGQALLNKLDSYRRTDIEVDNLISGVADYQMD